MASLDRRWRKRRRREGRLDAAEVPQEALGPLGARDEPPGERGHVAGERIAAPRRELGREVRRPVLHPGFVAVDQRAGELALAEPFERRQQLAEIFPEMEIERGGAELVAFEAAAVVGIG